MYDNIEAYMIYKMNHIKIIQEESENNFHKNRDLDEEEMNNDINKKVGELPIH